MKEKLALSDLLQECMLGMKVYDICRGQECLLPSLTNTGDGKLYINPASNGTEFNVDIYSMDKQVVKTTQPNQIFDLTGLTDVTSITIVENSLNTVINVKNITKSNLSNDGYWDINVEFRFNYAIQFNYSNGQVAETYINNKPATAVQAYSSYRKKITLYGGKSGNGVVYSFGALPNIQGQKPTHFIQAKSQILQSKICSLPESVTTPGTTAPTKSVVCVTIGLFSIAALVRLVKYNNVSSGNCTIPNQCGNGANNSICGGFNDLPFPMSVKIDKEDTESKDIAFPFEGVNKEK